MSTISAWSFRPGQKATTAWHRTAAPVYLGTWAPGHPATSCGSSHLGAAGASHLRHWSNLQTPVPSPALDPFELPSLYSGTRAVDSATLGLISSKSCHSRRPSCSGHPSPL